MMAVNCLNLSGHDPWGMSQRLLEDPWNELRVEEGELVLGYTNVNLPPAGSQFFFIASPRVRIYLKREDALEQPAIRARLARYAVLYESAEPLRLPPEMLLGVLAAATGLSEAAYRLLKPLIEK